MRLIRREESILLVTNGLSNEWDPSLHASTPDWTFGFEAALEMPLDALGDASDQAIEEMWGITFLWAALDWMVVERCDIRSKVEQFGCVTHAVLPVVGMEHLVASNGCMGALVGLPFAGDSLGMHLSLGADPGHPDRHVWMLPFKLLTADEYESAMGVQDSSRSMELAEEFLKNERHLSWPTRPSWRRHVKA